MTGTILAGGENRRIPLLKGHMEINGRRIMDSSVELLQKVFDRVIISTNSPENYFYCGVPMTGDISRQRGPLTGILSAIVNTADDVFVIGCDMPFPSEKLIRNMVERYSVQISDSPDAVIPVFEGKPQPLFGIYSRGISGIIEERLNADMRGMRDMLTVMNVLYITEEEVRKIDPEGRSFVNINTMEDLKKITKTGEITTLNRNGGKLCQTSEQQN